MRTPAAISADLKAAKLTVRDLKWELDAALREKHNIQKGDIVRSTSTGVEYRVTKIEFLFERPWVKGTRRRKDGEWSKQSNNLYGEWEKVADAAQD